MSPPPPPHAYSVLGGISSDTQVSWVYLCVLQYPGNKSVHLSVLWENQSMAECITFLIFNLTNELILPHPVTSTDGRVSPLAHENLLPCIIIVIILIYDHIGTV